MANMWRLFAILSAVLAALTAVFAKLGMKGIDSDLATGIRTVIVLLLAWAIVFAKGSSSAIPTLTRTNWTFLILSGLATGGSWIFYFKAMQAGKVSQVAPIDKSSLALTLLLSALVLGEAITWKVGVGAGLILLGTLIIIL